MRRVTTGRHSPVPGGLQELLSEEEIYICKDQRIEGENMDGGADVVYDCI